MGMSIMLFGRVAVLTLLPDLSVNKSTCSTSIYYLSRDAGLDPDSYFSSRKDSNVIS